MLPVHLQLLCAWAWCPTQTHTGLSKLLLPSMVKLAPGAMELPDPSALCPKPGPKVLLNQGCCTEGHQMTSFPAATQLQDSSLTLGPPTPSAMGSCIFSSTGARRAVERSRPEHRGTRGFEPEGLCASLALNTRCTVMPSLAPTEG